MRPLATRCSVSLPLCFWGFTATYFQQGTGVYRWLVTPAAHFAAQLTNVIVVRAKLRSHSALVSSPFFRGSVFLPPSSVYVFPHRWAFDQGELLGVFAA